jgi:hypothetical protein
MACGIAAGHEKEQRYKDKVSHTQNINRCILFLKDCAGFKYVPIDITNYGKKDGLVVAPYNQILPLIRKHMWKKIGFEKY